VGLFFIRGQEILMMRRGEGARNGRGCWALPGGMVDEGEDVDSCVLRETWEELGIEAIHWRILETSVDWPTNNAIVHWILVDAWRGEPSIQEPEKCSNLSWKTTDWIFGADQADASHRADSGSPIQSGEQVWWTPLNLWRRILMAFHVFPEGKELTDEAFEVFIKEAEAEEEEE